jgi:hypothetical protein
MAHAPQAHRLRLIDCEEEDAVYEHMPFDEPVTDLDFRAANGVQITLLWDRACGRVWIAVRDEASDHEFEVEVLEGENALDVFRHPYAYAASRQPELLAA